MIVLYSNTGPQRYHSSYLAVAVVNLVMKMVIAYSIVDYVTIGFVSGDLIIHTQFTVGANVACWAYAGVSIHMIRAYSTILAGSAYTFIDIYKVALNI